MPDLVNGRDGLDTAREMARLICERSNLFVLTGAGCSTDSGIPDYRDLDGNWKRPPPVTQQEFLRSSATRERYWSRSMIGWPLIAAASPNDAHHALAELERMGHVVQLVTQNVDGLHQRAGSEKVIDLHGQIARVVCLDCGALRARAELQTVLEIANGDWIQLAATSAPDGDADVATDITGEFRVATCANCDGMLKPDVVFYGDNVPPARVAAAMNSLENAGAMLVVGSSLSVYSGYRFCLRAKELGIPILAVNAGRTRADRLFALKVEAPSAVTLRHLVQYLAKLDPFKSPPHFIQARHS